MYLRRLARLQPRHVGALQQTCQGVGELPCAEPGHHLPQAVSTATSAAAGARSFVTGLGYEALTQHGAEDLTGKTCLVTGSTDGIGKHTAHLLAAHGCTVLLHGRDTTRVRRTLRSIKQSSGNPNVYGYAYDLSTVVQTQALASHVRRDVERWFSGKLHCLINNAGVFEEEMHLTEEGLESTWAVNVAAPFVLTGELLDLISERIVNVSSISMADTLDFEDLQQEKGYKRDGHAAYGVSKLALNMMTYRLARKMERTSVTVNCIDPGTVSTKLCYAGWGPVSHVALKLEDADDEFWAASSPDLAAVTGKYFVNKKARQSPPFSYDEDAQQRLWLYLEQQTGVVYKVPWWRGPSR